MTRQLSLVVLGSVGTGKSSITVQFIQGSFIKDYDPNIEEEYRKIVEIDGEQILLLINDTAGTEQFTAMRDLYLKNGHGFMLIYSISSESTFQELINIRQQIIHIKDTENIPMVLVGNKHDLEENRVVAREKGEQLAKEFNCPFYEASAKTGENIDAIFFDLVRQVAKLPNARQEVRKKRRCIIS